MANEQRMFPPVPTGLAGEVEQSFGHRITCTVKGCAAVEVISAGSKSSAGGLPDDVVSKKAKQRGWTLRRGGRDRRCPDHSGGGRLQVPGDDRRRVAGTDCHVEGCKARLTIERGGKSWPIVDGFVKVPRSIVAQAAQREGWLFLDGHGVCATHKAGFTSAKIVLRSILDPAGMRAAILKDCAPDCTTPDGCVASVMDDAEDRAAETYGDRWEAMKQEARDMAAAQPITPAAPAAPPEEDPMPTPPPEPTRDDKRRINAKLTDCCTDDGYAGDWSDAKVAAALDVPPAWVAAIRSEFFTDHDSNEASRVARRENQRALHELQKDFKAAEAKLEGALGTLAEAERAFTGLRTRMATLEGKI